MNPKQKRFSRNRAGSKGNSHQLLLCAFLLAAAAAPAPAGTGNETPYVNPFFMLSGALLADSFDGPQLDATLWSRPSWLVDNHKTIGVKIENGHLVISGPSHPAGGGAISTRASSRNTFAIPTWCSQPTGRSSHPSRVRDESSTWYTWPWTT